MVLDNSSTSEKLITEYRIKIRNRVLCLLILLQQSSVIQVLNSNNKNPQLEKQFTIFN